MKPCKFCLESKIFFFSLFEWQDLEVQMWVILKFDSIFYFFQNL